MTAFTRADILLPKVKDMEKWAVVACDQYTSEPDYWAETEAVVGGEPSALRLILPEVYLEDEDVAERIEDIHKNMRQYLADGLFEEKKNSFIYIERVQSDGLTRAGIVGKIDLEQYDYTKGSKSAVRATEATVIERIPPRVKIRTGAPIELPHIMILIDDPERTVVEPLTAAKAGFEKLYDFELMQGGGSIRGLLVSEEAAQGVERALEALGDPEAFNRRYGLNGEQPLVYAMGDGNHSLATAKAYYEQLKAEHAGEDLSGHPARYALVEIVNLHSEALRFEAIHRIVTGVDPRALLDRLKERLKLSDSEGVQRVTVVEKGVHRDMYIGEPLSKLAVGSLQAALDEILPDMGGRVDYIHGAEVIDRLSQADDAVGFLLPDMGKEELFPTVIADGALPRKTFSMGHAADKRYYIEVRRIDG